jgi:DNA-binding transcriptional MocR family regulator
VSFKTGQLDPSVAFLMERLKRSRDAVVRALAALREHGFLDWLRRYEPTGQEGRGPQVRQVSNAYRLVLPPRAARLLGIHGQDVPLPDDLAHAQEVRRAEMEAHKAGLTLSELGAFVVDDDRLGQVLAQLGRCLQERESGRQTESQARSFL